VPRATEKAVGIVIWRLVRWYLWRRYGTTLKRVGAGAAVAVVAAGGIALAQRRTAAPADRTRPAP
jgi:uncharacterized protein with ACT and thioredoxin-like domain